MKKTQKTKQIFGTLFFLAFGIISQAQEIVGSWHGTLEVQGTEMPLVFNVSEEEGVLSSTMDSPSQGATGIAMDETTFADNQLTLVFKQAGIKYVGKATGDTMEGTFFQGGMELPLNLEKKEKTIPGNPALVSSEDELLALASLDEGDYRFRACKIIFNLIAI
ncbi:MAG: S9 family peptidase, partial [Bacteroidota bacterium]